MDAQTVRACRKENQRLAAGKAEVGREHMKKMKLFAVKLVGQQRFINMDFLVWTDNLLDCLCESPPDEDFLSAWNKEGLNVEVVEFLLTETKPKPCKCLECQG
jgi:hypothetical protein